MFLYDTVRPRLYCLLRQHLSQSRRDEIKRWHGEMRNRTKWIGKVLHGTYSARELVGELTRRIPEDVEILFVHSSYDRLLPMCSDTPQQVVEALIRFCDHKRTLVMPAFCLGGAGRDRRAYYQEHVFDLKRTRSEMGLITELFRRWPGVKRSLHPTHSVCALGPQAEELVAGHHLCPTRAGRGTPFEKLTQRQCAIAGLGVDWFRVLTQVHTAEDLLGDDFPVKFRKETFPVILVDGQGARLEYPLTILRTTATLDNMVLRSLLQRNELQEWRFRGTPMFVTFAERVTSRLLEAAREGLTVYGVFRGADNLRR